MLRDEAFEAFEGNASVRSQPDTGQAPFIRPAPDRRDMHAQLKGDFTEAVRSLDGEIPAEGEGHRRDCKRRGGRRQGLRKGLPRGQDRVPLQRDALRIE